LSGDQARVNVKPELEIYAEEVTASHGATVGQIDESSMFYLRARGIPEKEARAMLKYAFLAEPIENIKDNNVKEHMLELLSRKCSRLQG
jgi:Fe-S cluster assembly protein SufD